METFRADLEKSIIAFLLMKKGVKKTLAKEVKVSVDVLDEEMYKLKEEVGSDQAALKAAMMKAIGW